MAKYGSQNQRSKVHRHGNPRDYWVADLYSIGELNARNHSLANYRHDTDYKVCQLKDRYAWSTWRLKGLAAPYLSPSGLMKTPRDDQHAWYYFMEEAYYITANPWIKDWYEFIGEFRKATLINPAKDSKASRAIGNMFSNALQAYRVTGDMNLLNLMPDYVRFLRSLQDPQYGFKKTTSKREATFQAGFMLRAFISYMSEIKDLNPQAWAEAFQFISGYMEWNYNFSSFASYFSPRIDKPEKSVSAALTFVDPQAWYYLHTGISKYLDHLNGYLTTGYNGGAKALGNFKSWTGQFEGRYLLYIRNTSRTDSTPPAAIADLSIAKSGQNLQLKWSPPAEAVYYHIVYSDKPISAASTTDENYMNWWAANTVGNNCVKTGSVATCSFQTTQTGNIYAAVFSFDKSDNMSAMSNLAALSPGAVPSPKPASNSSVH